MSDYTITRRSFLAGSAGVAALASTAGYLSFGDWQEAYAQKGNSDGSTKIAHTLCDGCGNQCAMKVWVKDDRLWHFMGDENHPNTRGRLCGRGQGFPAIAYSGDRITNPLKKNDKGEFEQISWDDAYSQLADKLTSEDPQKVAVFQARGSVSFFVQRFINALGSPNYFTDAAVHDADISSVIEAISGAYPAPDVGNSKFIVMLDKSTYDGFRPAEAMEFAELHERGGKVITVDPRMTSFSRVADEWVPIRPGTELAFLLGVAGEIVRRNAYDKEFIQKNGRGFEDFSQAVTGYSLDWASEKTGIPADKIGEITGQLLDAAPACFIDMPWAGVFGSGYKNSAETVRMTLLTNALLGNTNQPGGWLFGGTPFVSPDMLDASIIKPLNKLKAQPVGSEQAPLSGSSCIAAFEAMKQGDISTAIFCETNPVRDYPYASSITDALGKLDCMVVLDVMMTETAEHAHYVLPLVSYLERSDQINTVASLVSVAALRSPVIQKVHPETKSMDEIFTDLGKACGLDEYFSFSLDDYNRLTAEAMKIDYQALKSDAVVPTPSTKIEYGTAPYYRTKDFGLDFSSPAFQTAGLSAVPTWVDPLVDTTGGTIRLLIGEQAFQAHTYTVNDEMLTNISKQYELDGVWINESYATSLNIKSGDMVELSTPIGELTTHAIVTKRIHPEAVWLPTHYGCTAKHLTVANGFGVAPKQLIPWGLEPGTGAGMMHEVGVTVKKAGA